jgi:hypothetical protein
MAAGQDVHQEHLSAAQLAQHHPLLHWRLRAKQLINGNGTANSNNWSQLTSTAGLPTRSESVPLVDGGTGDAGSLSSQSAHVLHNVVLPSGVMADMVVESSHDSTSNTEGSSTSHPGTSTSSSRPAPTCTFLLTPADLGPKAVEAVLEAAAAQPRTSTTADKALKVQGSGIAGGGVVRKSGRQQQPHQQSQGKRMHTGSGAEGKEGRQDPQAASGGGTVAGAGSSKRSHASQPQNSTGKAGVRDDQAQRQEAARRGVAWAANVLSESLGPRAGRAHVPPKLKVRSACLNQYGTAGVCQTADLY